jgi:hypothetical protein
MPPYVISKEVLIVIISGQSRFEPMAVICKVLTIRKGLVYSKSSL